MRLDLAQELALNIGSIFICSWCGEIYPKKRSRKVKVCSSCRNYRDECKEIIEISKSEDRCLTCNSKFIPTKSLRKKDAWKKEYCSWNCYKKNDPDFIIKKCKYCGKDRVVHKKYEDSENIFCDPHCRDSGLRTQKCKKCGTIFKYNKFVPYCFDCYDLQFVTKCQECGKPIKKKRKYVVNSHNYEIVKDKVRLGKKGLNHRFIKSEMIYCSNKCAILQERPYYYEGISDEIYPHDFNEILKSKIKKRDNNQCQLCGAKQDLVIHHIDYNKENNEPTNLITLCKSCHPKTNYKRKTWVQLFSNYIIQWFGETMGSNGGIQ